MSSRAEILRSQITGCSNPASDPSLNQSALRAIREGEGRFNRLKGKAWRVARREARRMQVMMQDSEVQPTTLGDTTLPKIP